MAFRPLFKYFPRLLSTTLNRSSPIPVPLIIEQIYDEMASAIIAQLLFLQAESSTRPIHIYINSPGGVITAGLAIYDTIQYVTAPVATCCIGQAASMGSLLLCAGRPGLRYALPNSRIMVHQPSGGFQGQATDIMIHAEEILRAKKQLIALYSKHTRQPINTIETSMERDRFMSAEEARTYGLIDQVVASAASAEHVSQGAPS